MLCPTLLLLWLIPHDIRKHAAAIELHIALICPLLVVSSNGNEIK